MSDSASIVDPFHRDIHAAVAQDIENRMISLAEGSAPDYGAYRYQTGYIQALNAVLEKCRELELERYGKRPGEGQQQ